MWRMKDKDHPMRRCTDCPEHSGMEARLDAGNDFMERLEQKVDSVETKLDNHIQSQSKRWIGILISAILILATLIGNIFVTTQYRPKDQYSSQAEMTLLVKEITKAIKEAKKP